MGLFAASMKYTRSTYGRYHESSNLLPTWRFVYKQVWRQRVLKISLSDDINNNVEIRGILAHRFPSHAFTWWTAVDETYADTDRTWRMRHVANRILEIRRNRSQVESEVPPLPWGIRFVNQMLWKFHKVALWGSSWRQEEVLASPLSLSAKS